MSPRLGRIASVPPLLTLLLAGCSDYDLTQFQAQDLFYQEPAGEVDIALVVDNSCSMAPYQQKLAQNFDNFLSYLQEGQVQYRIGVLTTTIDVPEPYSTCTAADVAGIPAGGYLVDGVVIDNDTANAENIFQQLVQVGTCGSGNEMGLESAFRALSPPLSTSENIALLRDTAMMSIIFVSDEQDASPSKADDYVNYFRSIKGFDDRSAVNVNALVVEDVAECSQQQVQSGATEGTRYVYAAEETDGLVANICQDDFAEILTELSYRASRLRDTFYLTKLPAPGSLFVAVNDVEVPCSAGEWSYELEVTETGDELGKIVFERDSLPPPDSVISIIYDYGNGDPADFCSGDAAEE